MMDEVSSSSQAHYSTASTTSTHAGREPTLSTEVDDPSHPLYHHRRIVTDFDYGDILGEGSYSTVKSFYFLQYN
jgi:3-phosphoinositide dependent protein kinase-1